MSTAKTSATPRSGKRRYVGVIPHMKELGLETLEAKAGVAVMRLPYQERLVGNIETGVLHGGAVTTLIDSVCGLAVISGLAEPCRIATLDLRIDYLRPATPEEPVVARAECYKVTRQVAFVRGTAYHGDRDDPIASAHGTFMLLRRDARTADRDRSAEADGGGA